MDFLTILKLFLVLKDFLKMSKNPLVLNSQLSTLNFYYPLPVIIFFIIIDK